MDLICVAAASNCFDTNLTFEMEMDLLWLLLDANYFIFIIVEIPLSL